MKKTLQRPPLNEVEPIFTIRELLDKASARAGDKLAFRYRQGKKIIDITYSQFLSDTIALGTALNKLGVSSKHIACIGENSYDWITTYLTVLKSSGVFVPIDKELPFEDILNVVNSSDSEVLFYSGKYEDDIIANASKFKNVKYFIGFDRDFEDKNFLSFSELKESGMALYSDGYDEYLNEKSDRNALKLLVYTSGTTGMAKGVMLSEHNLVSLVYYGLQTATIHSSCLSILPYHHTYEAVAGILVALHFHATICINDSLKNVLKNLQTFKPEYIYVVPAFVELFERRIWANAEQSGKAGMLKKMIKMADALHLSQGARRKLFSSVHKAFGGNLKQIVCGGAPLRAEIGKFFESIGITLLNGYGITECSPLVSVNSALLNDCTTVGFPLPCCQIKFENIDSDGNGEICVKGDTVMLGYYKNPELTAEVIQDGWFNTGDCGRFNELGQLLITGRKKNIIVLTNGKNVFPEEIENYIMGIPYIKEALVYSIKDELGHETGLCTEVYLDSDACGELGITDAAAALKRDINSATSLLPSYKHISEIKIRDEEFPKTTTNKIKRSNAQNKN